MGRTTELAGAALPPVDSTLVSSATRLDAITAERARMLVTNHARKIAARTDRLFSLLMLVEWVATVAIACAVSPRDGAGSFGALPTNVGIAFVLGAAIAVPAAALARRRAGLVSTRHVVGVAQMLLGALVIHVTGGRIESHFYVFGSLAFLAFYRDWRVLVSASLVVVADHLLGGALLPESVYGVASASVWRSVEHAGWLLFADAFLVASCVRSRTEILAIAERRAQLEHKADVEANLQAAEEANRLKSEFLANVSHEIRTPMTAIQGYADLLVDPRIEAVDRVAHAKVIRRNSELLLRLIDDVLDLSKIEAGKMELERVACCPAQIVAEVASLMRVRAAQKRLALDIVFATPVPETIHSDPTRLRQILTNLVGNAVKFTEQGRITVTVRCEGPSTARPRLVFEVSDTGIGLSEDEIGRLFLPFSQADSSTTRRFGGTGLGLVICRRLAIDLGGGIAVTSRRGAGSTFAVDIATGPLAGVAMQTSLREAGPAPSARAVNVGAIRGRILLAEDGPDNQLLISTYLRKAGAEVTVAGTGQVAVEKALKSRDEGRSFDVVLMDMQMPVLDGYAATAQLRRAGYRGPVVALTAHAMTGDREKCIAAGCDDYLTKPIDRATLLGTAARWMAPTRVDPAAGHEEVISEGDVSELADDPDMTEILEEFVQSLPQRAGEIEAAVAEGDWEGLRRLTHQLKGSAGSYGFPWITRAAGIVEEAAVAERDCREQVTVFADMCRRARSGRGWRRSA